VYLEPRTIRADALRGRERGGLTETAGVFAIVIESDADKQMGWSPNGAASPSMIIETHHYWFFLREAVSGDVGQRLGELVRKAVGADHDSGTVTQPYRVAGTPNFPGKKKRERGRVVTVSTRIVDSDPERLWTPAELEEAFALAEERPNNGANDARPNEALIPPDTMKAIRNGVADGQRSDVFFNVMVVLERLGFTADGAFALLEEHPNGIAEKYVGRLQHEVKRVFDKLKQRQSRSPDQSLDTPLASRIASKEQFLAGFIPPDYLIDGILHRRFVYALTGQTGHAKTAIALLIAELAASSDPNAVLGPHRVEKGQVLYLVGENADDIRMRLIGADSVRLGDPSKDRISFIVGVFNVDEMMATLKREFAERGPLDLVIVDTSAAYFFGADELSNTDMGKHARILRALTTLPGAPCVLVLCHPIKHVTEPSQLLPRGGGAFLAEMDGNLTCWLHDETLVQLHHNKIRGPGFEPMTFKLEKFTTPKLVDAKGRPIPTVRVIHAAQSDEDRQASRARDDEDRILVRLLGFPNLSMAEIAIGAGWTFKGGEAAKSRVQRAIDRLSKEKPALVVKKREKWILTEKGKEAARLAAIRFEQTSGNDNDPDPCEPP
jgi:hypothetical protein